MAKIVKKPVTKKTTKKEKPKKEKPFASLKSTATAIKDRQKRNQAALKELDNY